MTAQQGFAHEPAEFQDLVERSLQLAREIGASDAAAEVSEGAGLSVSARLGKLDRGEYAAIILAAAGLKRLGLAERIRSILPSTASLPAAGQGALGIETRADRADVAAWLAPLNHDETQACVTAERAVSRALGGSCSVPLAAYGVIEGNLIVLRARVGAPDGSRMLETEVQGAAGDAVALGERATMELRKQGADAILAALRSHD